MALPATHLRFAVETAPWFEIKNQKAFLSGTLYPDSRWLTGVHRTATHHEVCLNSTFADTDFRAGWHIHCLCDRIQKEVLFNRKPALEGMNRRDGWIHQAVAKMIQDMADISHIEMTHCLSALDHIETPNAEDHQDIERYYLHIRNVYGRLSTPAMDDYRKLWQGVGLEDHLLSEILHLAGRLMADAQYLADIQGMYEEMVTNFMHRYQPQIMP